MERTLSLRRYGWWVLPVFWRVGGSCFNPSWLADRWVISDPLERADGIVVLGGRIDVRASTAAALPLCYQQDEIDLAGASTAL